MIHTSARQALRRRAGAPRRCAAFSLYRRSDRHADGCLRLFETRQRGESGVARLAMDRRRATRGERRE